MDFTLEKFVLKTLELLEKEREAEIEETRILQENVPLKELQRKGVCLLKLRLGSQHTGLYGRAVLVFEAFWPGNDMASHSFTPGDIAGLSVSSSEPSGDQIASGIVSKVTQSSVSVAFDEQHDVFSLDDQTQYKLMKLANNVTYRRLKKALNNLNYGKVAARNNLTSVLFGETDLGPSLCSAKDGVDAEVVFLNPDLDVSQREAVQFALSQRELAIIHGPPGTGKTTTVVEIIQQCISRKLKILACAPSNIAVDNLVERLAVNKARVVRLGHPARLLPGIQRYALDALLGGSDETQLVRDVRSDMDKALSKLRKTRDKGERQRLREDMKSLRREYREREKAAVTAILEKADVVLATLTGASEEGPLKHLPKEHFDLVVIDECSQSLEAACWIALTWAPKCILAGDHNQLPPTILSHEAAKNGLETTLMERLLSLYGNKAMRMLTMQYRMHQLIMKWASDQLYEGKLLAHASVASHLLSDLPHVESNALTSIPLLMIDTAGCALNELDLAEEVSKGNEGEADIVAAHVDALVNSGLPANDIAVIAPYNLQVDLLRLRLTPKHPPLEIKSVDGFQGREKEAVIISLVRSNDRGEVGFLAEDRRINVAVTRARRHLTVVCDSETVSHHAFLKSLVDYMTDNGDVRSAQEFIDEGVLNLSADRPEYLDDHMKRPAKSSKAVRPKTNKKTDAKKPSFKEKQEQKRAGEDLSLKRELEKTLTEFFKSSEGVLAFPSTLNSFQRLCIHEIAGKLGLSHVSHGEGEDRHIVVSKSAPTSKKAQPNSVRPKKPKVVPEDYKENRQDKEEVKKQEVKKDNKEDKTEEEVKESKNLLPICEKCKREIPVANYELHILRCDVPQQKSAKPKKKKSAKKEAKVEESEDFDELVEAAIRSNTSCHFPKCKTKTSTLGQNCPFCAQRFCLTHFMAEMHGCGARAKESARVQISRDGVLYRGSGVPDRKPSANKRGHLERKLEGKLTEMNDKRKPKNKEK